jgi:hypothetical protein
MIRLPRLTLSLFTLAFGLYHSILGLSHLGEYQDTGYAIFAIFLYLIGLTISVASKPGLHLKLNSALLVLAVAILVPLMMSAAISSDAAFGYTTWHVSGVATLMAITAVRQQPVIAWIGVTFLIVQTLVWGGSSVIFNSGIFGAFLLVLAAQATSTLLASSAKSAQRYLEKALATDAQTAAKTAARAERQRRIQHTLNEALPLLELIVARKGKLSAADRSEAVLKEHELRDQIRGRSLLTPGIVQSARDARKRGVEVQLLDDGGLDETTEAERQTLLDQIAQELRGVKSGKVVIRAVRGETWKLTMAAIRKDADRPDLFLRL